ncbi:uncharacterized protein KZ484_021174 [Pholidichthys leucotaenia]
MDNLAVSLLLVLLLCYKGQTVSQTSCPHGCQCFTPVQVLCAHEQMTSLPKNMSRQVKEFIAMTTGVTYLVPHTLAENPQLTKLIFLNNGLRSIHAHTFECLTELQELEISGNPWLEHLFLGTFSNQGNLTKLILNFNLFKTVLPGMFNSLKQLEMLQIRNNIISHLPAFIFQNLSKLQILDLSQNKLKEVKRDTLFGLAELQILKINNNIISNFTSDTFHNVSQLTELHLEGNKIAHLDNGIFSVLTKLKVLNLRGNHLTTFTDDVFGYEGSNLKELNLKANYLSELSSLSSLTSLTNLILSSNKLSNISEDIFRNLTALESLDLSENQLTSLPPMIFKGLFSIEAIHLYSNNLTQLDTKLFVDQAFIQRLYLSDNLLETVPTGLFDPFLIQHTLRLHGNPWKCDCRMWYLHDWVLKNSQDVEMLDRMLCESPDFLRKRTVVSIAREQLVCHLSKDEMTDLSSCSLQTSNNTVIIKCKVDKCSPLTVKVQLHNRDGSVVEHVVKEPENSQCSSETE